MFVVFGATAQETLPVYSDYLTDNYYLIHPSMAGASSCTKVRVTGRQQWFGQENAPALYTASINTRFNEDRPSAGGAILFKDGNGYHSRTGAYLTYAHHLLLSRNDVDLNMVSFGLSAGLIQSQLDQSEWFDIGPSLGLDPDIVLQNSNESSTYFNVDLGVSYHLLDFYAHFTIKNVIGSGRDLYTAKETKNLQRYIFSMGYVFSGLNSSWTIEPSVMFHHITETKESQFDVNAKVYKTLDFGKVWGGLSYRRSLDGAEYATSSGSAESQKLQYITPFIGVNYDKYMFGYTYSHQTGQLKLIDGGFHQITLGLNLFCKPEKYDCNCPAIN